MNTPNPLIPHGSFQSRGKSTVRTAFFTIAAIHVVFIGGLLIQGGCKKSDDKPIAAEDTNALPPLASMDVTDTNVPGTNYAAPVVTNPSVDVAPPVGEVSPPAVNSDAGKEYVVAKGDSFSTIAKKMGVSVKAIEQANPGVNSSRLQIGQKLQIPAASVPSATTTVNGVSPANGDGTTYVVKTGDMLEIIARRYGTTAKEIMRLNNLKTTMIKPGQKLKVPASGSTEPNTTSPNYVTPLPSPAAGTNP